MKETFPGYYKGTDLVDALKTNKIIIVLDSSVLCNLYGLPDDVWKKILDLIKIKEDCLWLPYKLAEDYHKGIIDTITNKIQSMINLKNKLEQTQELMRAMSVSFPEMTDYVTIAKEISNRLTREIALIKQRGQKGSDIRESIAKLYKNKVGQHSSEPNSQSYKIKSYNQEVTETDAISGENPTIIENASKIQNQIKSRNDLILHMLIKLSKDKEKDIVYVITEPSEYWSIFIGKTSYGPHPEHQTYFSRNSLKHSFYCCPFASFINHLAKSQGEELTLEFRSIVKKMSYGATLQNDDFDEVVH